MEKLTFKSKNDFLDNNQGWGVSSKFYRLERFLSRSSLTRIYWRIEDSSWHRNTIENKKKESESVVFFYDSNCDYR